MTQPQPPGYQAGGERTWWWKIAMHLDEAQRASFNVLAHNVEDPTPVHVLQGKLREMQAFLLEIFRWKGLLPGAVEGPKAAEGPAEVPKAGGVAVGAEDGWIIHDVHDVVPSVGGSAITSSLGTAAQQPTTGSQPIGVVISHSFTAAEVDILPTAPEVAAEPRAAVIEEGSVPEHPTCEDVHSQEGSDGG